MAYDDRESAIQGADYTYWATVRCSAADPLVKAWLTFKTDLTAADPGTLQKVVTTSNAAGTGQIVNDGSTTGGIALIRFDLTAANMTAFSPRDYLFDVKVKTNSGAEAFGAQGLWHIWQANTTSSS